MIKAIGFDLGDTLIEYRNIPLNWDSVYTEALSSVLSDYKEYVSDMDIAIGKKILTRFNTRVNPREIEVCADEIFTLMLKEWDIDKTNLSNAIKIFFSFFQKKALVFDETYELLRYLKMKGIKVGILTDVPYGMPSYLVNNDIIEIKGYINCLLTSVDVGFRKPNTSGYLKLADKLNVSPEEMMYVGNEQKDIEGANKSNMVSVLINRNSTRKVYGQNKTIRDLREFKLA